MTRLARYVSWEIFVPLASWVGFLFLLLLAMSFLRGTDMLLGSGVGALDLLTIAGCLTPHFLQQALPVAFLLALLLGLGRLAEDGELTAMSALGVSPGQLVRWPLMWGAALATVSLVLAFTLEPWGMQQVSREANELIKRNLVGDVKSGVFYDEVPDFTLYAERVDRAGWHNVLLHDERNADVPLLVLARSGHVDSGRGGESIELSVAQGSVHRSDRATSEYSTIDFERGALAVGVGGSFAKNTLKRTWEEFTPMQLLEEALDADIARDAEIGNALRMTFHWRLGQVGMPLAFALWATPLALGRRGGGRARGFVLTLAGYVAYYVLGRVAAGLAQHGHLPFLFAGQLGNVVFALLGVFALWRVSRTGALR